MSGDQAGDNQQKRCAYPRCGLPRSAPVHNIVQCLPEDHAFVWAEAPQKASADWIPVEQYQESDKWGHEVRIRLRDGSELDGAILQHDGDWWWRERYFDPAEVTHVAELRDSRPPEPERKFRRIEPVGERGHVPAEHVITTKKHPEPAKGKAGNE